MSGFYSLNDVDNIIKDLGNKYDACRELGLDELSGSLNDAINLIEWMWEGLIKRYANRYLNDED